MEILSLPVFPRQVRIESLLTSAKSRADITVSRLSNKTEYGRTPPVFVNRDRIPPDVLQIFNSVWYQTEQAVAPVDLVCFEGVFADLDGYLVSPDGVVFRETVAQCDLGDRYEGGQRSGDDVAGGDRMNVREPAPASDLLEISEPCLLLKKAGYANYGHWLIEMLPRLAFFRRAGISRKVKIAIHQYTEPLRRRIYETLRLAGVPAGDVIEIPSSPVFFHTLYWVSPISIHNRVKHPDIFAFLREMSASVRGDGSGRRLFVSRKLSRVRHLTNEDEIYARLKLRGFRRVFPELVPVAEQIRLFRSSEMVAGALGAALTNLAFMPSGGKVILLAPERSLDFFFYDISCHTGQQYASIHGPSRGSETQEIYHGDFSVDPADVEDALAHINA